jgi:thioredoxin-dependent peroxiredoxin
MAIKEGDNAPNFKCLADNQEVITLSDYSGKNVVLYFYPKDDTPGCTLEAQGFRDKIDQFIAKDTVIIGVSKDNLNSHCKFVEKYKLPFRLLADVDGEICKAYDIIKEKSMYGKTYLGIDRSTFLIDKKGKIVKIWRGVSVNGHVDKVLNSIA